MLSLYIFFFSFALLRSAPLSFLVRLLEVRCKRCLLLVSVDLLREHFCLWSAFKIVWRQCGTHWVSTHSRSILLQKFSHRYSFDFLHSLVGCQHNDLLLLFVLTCCWRSDWWITQKVCLSSFYSFLLC